MKRSFTLPASNDYQLTTITYKSYEWEPVPQEEENENYLTRLDGQSQVHIRQNYSDLEHILGKYTMQ